MQLLALKNHNLRRKKYDIFLCIKYITQLIVYLFLFMMNHTFRLTQLVLLDGIVKKSIG